MSLVDIQKNLAGADNNSLMRWAALPAGFWEAALARQAASAKPSSPDELLASVPTMPVAEGRTRFWEAEPMVAETEDRAVPAAVSARPAIVLSLAPGVSLIVEGTSWDKPDTAALNAVRPALDKLLAALAGAGIIEQVARDDRLQTTTNQGVDDGP
jgi:hypothetical protein